MNKNEVVKDERFVAVENASFKLGYSILSYGILVLIVVRSLLLNQTNWDLFALVIVSSFAATIYQIKNKTISFSWKWVVLFFGVMALSALIVLVIMMTRR